ncbi:MAG: C1 family peptidase [Methanothrix sp.]|nr:C1 family peptidase [Methanothrix sp.]
MGYAEEKKFGFGWIPDMPDIRDYTSKTKKIAPMLKKANLLDLSKKEPPESVDLRKWCSPVENQGGLQSCQTNAGVGLVEYFENRAFGKHINASRLFLYKVARKLGHWEGDSGATARSTMGALVLFGVPPEEYWPYTDKRPDFDIEPPAFCYAFAQNYQAIKYLRLDPPGISRENLLHTVKVYLAAGIPSMFGFPVYDSFFQSAASGNIPFPCPNERNPGGHIVMAVGYNDNRKIKNANCDIEHTGALLIRNSHGEKWGDGGYGWMPYEWILRGLAVDWWTLLKSEWVDTDQFRG